VSYQYSVSVERQLGARSVLSVGYVGNQNRHQNDYRETNLPSQSILASLINDTRNSAYNSSLNFNSVAPYRGFNSIRLAENAGNGHYNGLQVGLNSQMRDLSLGVAYTYSKAIDPSTTGDLYNVDDPYNRAYDNGPSSYDRTHILNVNWVYDLPFFKHSQNMFAKSALGGWQLSGIATAETGLPLFLTLNGSQGGNAVPNATNRPDVTGSITYPKTIDAFFAGSFAPPAFGAWGNLGKGAVRGPGRQNWNISLFKNFLLNERRGSHFELRIETFNTFNHTEFKDVSTGASFTFNQQTGKYDVSNNFGQVTSTWDPRTFQLGAKLVF
jgi:hypothetical protein